MKTRKRQSTERAPDETNRLGSFNRFSDAFHLWTVFNQAQSARKDSEFASIVAQYDRLPYKDDDNHVVPNFGSMRYKVDQSITTYVDYATERERWASIRTMEGEIEGNSALWSEHISTAFHKHCISNWRGKFSEVMLAVKDMLLFCRGVFMWGGDDPWDAVCPHSVDVSHVMPDAGAGPFPKTFDILFVKKRFTAVQLYRKVRNKKAAEKSGWRRDEVVRLLKESCSSLKDHTNDEIFERFGDNRISQPERDFEIDTILAYVVEYDPDEAGNCISHYVIPATVTPDSDDDESSARTKAGFLCYSERKHRRMEEVIGVVSSIVTRSYYEGKSYAELIYLTSRTYDLVTYRVLQAIEDNMRVYLESASSEHFKKLKAMRHKQYNLLPPGMKLIQDRVQRPVQEAMMVIRSLIADERAGTGQYAIGGTDMHGGAKTAKQSEIDLGESLKISGSEIKMFNAHMTGLMDEVYRRFVSQEKPEEYEDIAGRHPWKAFGRFKEYLKSKGVPDSAWAYDNVQVNSLVSLGAGSPAARLQAARVTAEALAIPASGAGDRRAQRDMVAAVQGIDNVDAYIPSDDQLAIPEDSLIGIENDILADPNCKPGNAPVLPHQMHVRHIESHTADAEASLQIAARMLQARPQMPQIDDGIILKTIQDMVVGVDHKLAHVQAHIKMAVRSKDKKRLGLVEQFKYKIAALNKQQDALENMLNEAMKQRAEMGGGSQPTAEELRVQHLKTMYQLEEEHTAKMLSFDAAKGATKAEQLREQSAANAEHRQQLETVKTAHEIRLKSAIKTAEAAAKITEQNASPQK